MTLELFEYLETNWKYYNHSKYQRYFKEWIKNITDSQIQGFTKIMNTTLIK
jgi:hypothetical protein